MRFVGIDLAWGSKNCSGFVMLETSLTPASGRLTARTDPALLHSDDAILDALRAVDDGGGMLVGVDAPLDVPNLTGERPVEAALRRCFGRYQAGAHPANRTRFHDAPRGERLSQRLEQECQLPGGYDITPRDPTMRRCFEVFPHPAQVVLFGLERTLKYKARPGRTLEFRLAELERLVAGLRSLAHADPALEPPDWLVAPQEYLRQYAGASATGRRPSPNTAFKAYEDQLDALTCAYVAAYFWHWGDGERCMVIGDKANGYIVTPIRPDLRRCIEGHEK